MAKRSKAYKAAEAKIEEGKLYTPAEAVALAKETSSAKTDSTVEVALRLSVDPRKADQMVRGTVNLPHGTGKTARIAKIAGGWTDFDAAVATPDMMGKVGRLGKVLGPRNLMPNPKTGTVTMDVAKAVADIKGGKIDFRVDRNSNLHFIIGKASFSAEQLEENFNAALEEINRLKPSSAKGRYISKATVATTFGPGIPVDPASVVSAAA